MTHSTRWLLMLSASAMACGAVTGLYAQDDLEAAEHGRLGPGGGDDAVVDGDADIEVALDAAEGADEQIQ